MTQIQKKTIVVIIVTMMIFSAFSPLNIVKSDIRGFNDIDNHWGKDIITEAAEAGLVEGYPDEMFKPDGNIKREESMAILFRVYSNKIETTLECPFTDIQGEWFYDYIVLAYQEGLTKGTGENLFGAGNPITRQDMVTLMGRAMKKFNNIELPEIEEAKEINKNKFIDAGEIASYAEKYVAMLTGKGIIKGYPIGGGKFKFNPADAITRAEACSLMFHVWKEVNELTKPTPTSTPDPDFLTPMPTIPPNADPIVEEVFNQSDLVVRGTVKDVREFWVKKEKDDPSILEYSGSTDIAYIIEYHNKFSILIDYIFKGAIENIDVALDVNGLSNIEIYYANGSVTSGDIGCIIYEKDEKAIFFLKKDGEEYKMIQLVKVDENWNLL